MVSGWRIRQTEIPFTATSEDQSTGKWKTTAVFTKIQGQLFSLGGSLLFLPQCMFRRNPTPLVVLEVERVHGNNLNAHE